MMAVQAGVSMLVPLLPVQAALLNLEIFEPFFSTKGDKGNGLGLWISSEIARMHGGELSCDSGAQGGAVFRLRLPIDAREAPGDTPQPAAGNAAL